MITIPVKQNATFTITFKIATNSKYVWKVKELSIGVSFIRSEFETVPNISNLSEHGFTFSADSVGENKIIFELIKDEEVIEEKSYLVNIKE